MYFYRFNLNLSCWFGCILNIIFISVVKEDIITDTKTSPVGCMCKQMSSKSECTINAWRMLSLRCYVCKNPCHSDCNNIVSLCKNLLTMATLIWALLRVSPVMPVKILSQSLQQRVLHNKFPVWEPWSTLYKKI